MLASSPFYFSTVRNLTAAFGTLFTDIVIRRMNADGSVSSAIKVPLAYAAADKSIIMMQQRNKNITDNKVDVKVVLPRIGYELTAINYDATRKTQTINQDLYTPLPSINFNAATDVNLTTGIFNVPNHGLDTGRVVVYELNGATGPIGGLTPNNSYYVNKVDSNNIKLCTTFDTANAGTGIIPTALGSGSQLLKSAYARQYNPVPYDFEYTVYLFVKYIDDGLQIIEQIVPYFTPFYTITMNDIKAYGVSRDVTVTLNSVSSEDIYQGDVEEDRIVTWTLTFTAKGWIYPPIKDATGVIKIADVNFFDMDTDQKLTTVQVEVVPITAERSDSYTIETTITDF